MQKTARHLYIFTANGAGALYPVHTIEQTLSKRQADLMEPHLLAQM